MDSILLPLVRSSRLPKYVQELQRLLEEEAVAREKFIEWVTPSMKAEFINGEVIVHSPARMIHTDTQILIARLLSVHVDSQHLGKVQVEKAMVRLTRNDYEPNICFWTNKKSFHFKPEQMLFPAPDLVIEILSPSTEKTDRGQKFEDYADEGVQEYWIVDPAEQVVEQYALTNHAYQLRARLGGNDRIVSIAVQGFEVEVVAFFDMPTNLAALAKLVKI